MNLQLPLPLLAVLSFELMFSLQAQEQPAPMHDMQNMPGMDMGPTKPSTNAAASDLMNAASGTSLNPAASPMPMSMVPLGSWTTMFMGTGYLVDTQQSGALGGDKLYSPNWLMASADHNAGHRAALRFDLMLSLEPATVTNRSYPLLFQTGETAYGQPLTNAQHPHNFVMALGFHYARQLTENITLETYVAPVGDPALGPVAFPHRASAQELPQAPISHHWQDSTHVANNVVTAGLVYKKVKLEASGFHGAEPGENRWALSSVFSSGAIDSWSARLCFLPSQNWAAQVSMGRLAHPEALEAGDQVRATASLAYSKQLARGIWSTSAIWGHVHQTSTQRNSEAYLLETVLPIHRGNFLTGRVESVGKDDLFGNSLFNSALFNNVPALAASLHLLYGSAFRIGAYTFGYTRDVNLFRSLETGIGANFTAYTLPAAIKPYYGDHPVGGNIFIRIRLRSAGS